MEEEALNKGSTKYLSDDELYKTVMQGNFNDFTIKNSISYAEQLRFTENMWSILHLTVYYNRFDMTNILLESEIGSILVGAKDKNGETPLHLACYNCNATIALKLLQKGATLSTRNIYLKDPIETIQNYVKRKALVERLFKNSSKLIRKEIDIIRKHRERFQHNDAIGEIIFATENRN